MERSFHQFPQFKFNLMDFRYKDILTKTNKMKKNRISKKISLFTEDTADNVSYEDYGASTIQSLINLNETITEPELEQKAKEIF